MYPMKKKVGWLFFFSFFLFVVGSHCLDVYSNYRIHKLSESDFVGTWVYSRNPAASLVLCPNFRARWTNFPIGNDRKGTSGIGGWAFDNFEGLEATVSLNTNDNAWSIVPIFWDFYSNTPKLRVWHNIEGGDAEYFEKQIE